MLSGYRNSLQFVKLPISSSVSTLMEDEIDFSVILSHAHVQDLVLIAQFIDRLIPNTCAIHLFDGFKLGSILPNFIIMLECAH